MGFRLTAELENSLVFCAKELNKSKSKLVNEALVKYLEDLKDYISAKKVLARNETTFTLDQVEHELGL